MRLNIVLIWSFLSFWLSVKSQGYVITGLDLLDDKKFIEVPFQYINGHIILDVNFQGIFDVKFIFDTGAQNIVLFEKSYVDVFGLKPERTITLRGADLIGNIQASIVRNISMKLENSKIVERDILVLPTNFLRMEEIIGVDVIGIIGAEFFRNTIVKIDFDGQILTIFNPNKFTDKVTKGFEEIDCEFLENKF